MRTELSLLVVTKEVPFDEKETPVTEAPCCSTPTALELLGFILRTSQMQARLSVEQVAR